MSTKFFTSLETSSVTTYLLSVVRVLRYLVIYSRMLEFHFYDSPNISREHCFVRVHCILCIATEVILM